MGVVEQGAILVCGGLFGLLLMTAPATGAALGEPLLLQTSLPVTLIEINGKAEELCTSQECTLSAAAIIEAMDPSVDPCDDFYQYACGGWLAGNPIPEEASRWSQFNVLRTELSNALSVILKEPTNASDPLPLNQAKWFYLSCMDEEALELAGTTPLADLLNSLGGWPMGSASWNAANFDWQVTVAEGRKNLGYEILFGVWVFADEKSTDTTAIYLDQTSLGMPRSVLTSPENYEDRVAAYKTYIKATAQIMTANLDQMPNEADLDQDVDDILAFEMALANITTPDEDRRDIERMYNPMAVAELEELTAGSGIVWLDLFSNIFSGVGVTIDESTRVIVQELEYVQKVATLLQETEERVLANYLLWRFVQDLGDETTAAMRDASFQYDTVAVGVLAPTPRSETCADETNNLMGMAVGVPYVQRYFSAQAKNESNFLVEDLRAAFKDLLEVNEWMDEETKPKAMDKADAITKFIGYPDWYDEPNGLEDYYSDLTSIDDSTSHFENTLSLRYWWSSSELDDFGSPTDRGAWFSAPTIVNAFYLPEFNSITFPAGILQPPFYRANTLQAINYGGIGQVMGHEITHGFDDQGRQNDGDGNAIPWWTNATLDAFQGKAQCIIDQYNEYTLPEIDYLLPDASVNGVTTQGENIADNGGLREAYLAYQRYVQRNGVEPRLPGLEEFSSNQIFFIGNANIWCSAITDEGLLNQILTDPHSPERFRVLGPMRNMEQFSAEWGCPVGSGMNPTEKCVVW